MSKYLDSKTVLIYCPHPVHAGVEVANSSSQWEQAPAALANTKQDILTQWHVDNMVERSVVRVYPQEK